MKAAMKTENEIKNVYAELGFENAESMLKKAEVTAQLNKLIGQKKNNIYRAAITVGTTQKELEAILRGQFEAVDEKTLSEYLAKLKA